MWLRRAYAVGMGGHLALGEGTTRGRGAVNDDETPTRAELAPRRGEAGGRRVAAGPGANLVTVDSSLTPACWPLGGMEF